MATFNPLSLLALAQASNTDPNDTSETALRARGNQRKDLADQQERDNVTADPSRQYFSSFNNRPIGGLDQQWSPFYEGVQESGERATGNPDAKVSIGSAPGLTTDTERGTLPLSLQALPGASYNYDSFGFPVGMTQSRSKTLSPQEQEAQRRAAQPKPWSLG